jgi:hypothetical protein
MEKTKKGDKRRSSRDPGEQAVAAGDRLRNDPSMEEVIRKLKRRKADPRLYNWLCDTLPGLVYGEWDLIKNTSLKKEEAYYKKLIEKMRELVDLLESNETIAPCLYWHDADLLRHAYRLIPETRDQMKRGLLNPDAAVPSIPDMPLSDYLRGTIAFLGKDRPEMRLVLNPVVGTNRLQPLFFTDVNEALRYKPRKGLIKTLAIQRVFSGIVEFLPCHASKTIPIARPPNKETAVITTVLLGDLIEKPITANDVTHAVSKIRRKYKVVSEDKCRSCGAKLDRDLETEVCYSCANRLSVDRDL